MQPFDLCRQWISIPVLKMRYIPVILLFLVCQCCPAIGVAQTANESANERVNEPANDAHDDNVYTEGTVDESELPSGFEVEEIQEFETTVKDTTVASSAASTVVTQTQIAQSNATSADRLLQLVPGVEIVQHGSEGKGHQIMLRGFDAAHGSDVEVTLEGVSLNEPSQVHGPGYVDLYGIIPEVVKKIDVHMGSFLPFQGNFATGGSMNFVLGLPEDFGRLKLGAGIDNYSRYRSFAVFSFGDDQSFVAADVLNDNGFAAGREAQRGTAIVKLNHNFGNYTVLSAIVSAQTARFETPGTLKWSDVDDNAADFYDAHSPYGEGLSDRVFMRTGLEVKTDGTVLNAFLYGMVRRFSLEENYTGQLYYPLTGDRKRQTQKGEVGGAAFRLQKKLHVSIPVSLTGGLDFRVDSFHQRETQVAPDGGEWRINRSNKIRIYQLGTFAGVKVSPVKWITVFPSIRLDAGFYNVLDHQTSVKKKQRFEVVSPRIAASFPFSRMVTFFADYGKGFRFPEARAILYSQDTSDEDLKQYKGGRPEVSTCNTVETGLETTPVAWLGIRAAGFAIFMEREMVFDHVSNLTIEMDGTKRLGAELDIRVSPIDGVNINATTTYVQAHFNRSENPVPNVPTLMGTASIKAGRKRGLHGGADLFWMGRHNLAHRATIKGYAKVGLDGGYRFKNVDITTVIENVFNTQIMEGTYHFASWFDTDTPRSMIPEIQYVAGNPFTLRLLLTVFL
ncbi:MAG: TonB-dependent receptor [Deltaproteobacteria bacterium]|nr:TonB-dependent receptor [Deltaproteobacteria bacterium]